MATSAPRHRVGIRALRSAPALATAGGVALLVVILLVLLVRAPPSTSVPEQGNSAPRAGKSAPRAAASSPPPSSPSAPLPTVVATRATAASPADLASPASLPSAFALSGRAYLERSSVPLVLATLEVEVVEVDGLEVGAAKADHAGVDDLGVGVLGKGTASRRRVSTDGQGRFQLEALPEGTSLVIFHHGDERPASFEIEREKDQVIEGLDVIFSRGLTVWGRVLDLAEQPAAEAVLEWTPEKIEKPAGATGPPGPPGPPGGPEATLRETVTHGAGLYRIVGLEPGVYRVRVGPRLRGPLWLAARPRRVTVREDAANRFDFTADLGQTIGVQVLGGDGLPAAAALVRYRLRSPSAGATGFFAETDGEGRTRLQGLPGEGTLEIEAVSPPGQPPANVEGRAEVDLDLLPVEVTLKAAGRG